MAIKKQEIICVVTDLDDTVWDWLTMWYSSFQPYLKRLSDEFKIKEEVLKEDFKKLHQKYHTTEVSFAYEELSSLTDEQKSKVDEFSDESGKSILHEYYSNKKNKLSLYPDVKRTLTELKEKGVLIVAFTESNAFFTKTRIKNLELDGLIDYIYTPVGSGIPESVKRIYPESHWEPELTQIRHLSQYDKKPDKEILEIILEDFGVNKDEAVYIGDKLDRDIQMANDANVTSIYASYGNKTNSNEYELLRDVTHWTEEDIAREKKANKIESKKNVNPTFTFEKSYSEILDHFDFKRHKVNENNLELIPNVLTAWQKAVDVQKHFNDISIKIRNLSLTVLTFIIAGIGFLLKEDLSISIGVYKLPIAAVFSVFGFFIIASFYFMDKYWYHKYLSGTSVHISNIEKKWSKDLPEMGLSTAISKNSKFRKWNIDWNSNKRLSWYYGISLITMISLSVLLLVRGIPEYATVDKVRYDEAIRLRMESELKIQLMTDQDDLQKIVILHLRNEIDSLKAKRISITE